MNSTESSFCLDLSHRPRNILDICEKYFIGIWKNYLLKYWEVNCKYLPFSIIFRKGRLLYIRPVVSRCHHHFFPSNICRHKSLLLKSEPLNTGHVQLCIKEKYHMMFSPSTSTATLNQRGEIFSSCRHRRAKLLDNTWVHTSVGRALLLHLELQCCDDCFIAPHRALVLSLWLNCI